MADGHHVREQEQRREAAFGRCRIAFATRAGPVQEGTGELKKRAVCLLAIFTLAVMAGGYWLASSEPVTPIELAVEHCRECGMDREWVEQTVEDIRTSGRSREAAIAAWEQTYDDPVDLAEARETCLGCVEAVVGAAHGEP